MAAKPKKHDPGHEAGAMMAAGDAGRPGAEPEEVAGYIREVIGELRDLADAAEFPLLAYLLDMARHEAEARSRRRMGPAGDGA